MRTDLIHRIDVSASVSHLGRVALVAAAGATMLTACGDDSNEAEASPEYADFCAAELEAEAAAMSGDPALMEPAFAAALEAAPAADKEIVQRTIDAATEMAASDDGAPSEEFDVAYADLVGVVQENCGFGALDITATNYEFDGIGDDVGAGPTVITLTNEANEFHEAAIFRRNEGETRPVDELLELPEEEIDQAVSEVAFIFAAPESEANAVVDLPPGEYVMLCFLPTGATEAAFAEAEAGGQELDGAPHFTEGMVAEFEVAG